uniref:Uncharacterized protein n=1 Tax=Lepeophtheirus salmonis TaxID=72036 RepID=A0A0K2T0F5_LEPSM
MFKEKKISYTQYCGFDQFPISLRNGLTNILFTKYLSHLVNNEQNISLHLLNSFELFKEYIFIINIYFRLQMYVPH